jgi:hypothetical protein
MIEQIGNNAGFVWNALNDGGRMSLKEVKKAARIKTEKELFAAIGWLAKEGKLVFDETDGDTCIALR